MSNHTYRPMGQPPRPRRERPAPVARLVHYDPRTLARTEAPLRAVSHQCAWCSAMISPSASRRNEFGEWACTDRAACWAQVQRNECGG